jgi:hypothetical protein
MICKHSTLKVPASFATPCLKSAVYYLLSAFLQRPGHHVPVTWTHPDAVNGLQVEGWHSAGGVPEGHVGCLSSKWCIGFIRGVVKVQHLEDAHLHRRKVKQVRCDFAWSTHATSRRLKPKLLFPQSYYFSRFQAGC